MSRVLFINPYYIPGFKSGGPQRTVENIVDVFGRENDIYILTQDHDLGSNVHYEGITNHKWIQVGHAKVMYVDSQEFRWDAIRRAYFSFDIIYSCGLFEKNSIALLLINRMLHKKYGMNKKIYIAPMGVFSLGAYNNSSHKKKLLFVNAYKRIGAFKNIIWSFTTQAEVRDAEQVLGYTLSKKDYIIAEDLPRKVDFDSFRENVKEYHKEAGNLNLVFISRISPQKNLTYALEILNTKFDGEINYDIYGTREDKEYWKKCQVLMKNLPSNVHAKYCGELRPDQVLDTFSKYDAFLFPTKGENFGHVIYESMAVGCIPIVSDQTPWKGEEIIVHGLDDMDAFRDDIKVLIDEETNYSRVLRSKIITNAAIVYKASVINSGYTNLFKNNAVGEFNG